MTAEIGWFVAAHGLLLSLIVARRVFRMVTGL